MITFLLVLQALIAAALVGVILMQRSEGGGLGTGGGSPTGFMSARGAADFLTRSTAVLATVFVGVSIALAVFAAQRSGGKIDTSLAKQPAPTEQTAPVPMADPNAPTNAAAPVVPVQGAPAPGNAN